MLARLTYHYNVTSIITCIIIMFLLLALTVKCLLNPDLVCRLDVDQLTRTTLRLDHLHSQSISALDYSRTHSDSATLRQAAVLRILSSHAEIASGKKVKD